MQFCTSEAADWMNVCRRMPEENMETDIIARDYDQISGEFEVLQ